MNYDNCYRKCYRIDRDAARRSVPGRRAGRSDRMYIAGRIGIGACIARAEWYRKQSILRWVAFAEREELLCEDGMEQNV